MDEGRHTLMLLFRNKRPQIHGRIEPVTDPQLTGFPLASNAIHRTRS